MARWSAAMAEHAKSKVVKTAAVMVVEYVLMITFQGLLFSTEAGPRNTGKQPDSHGPLWRLAHCSGRRLQLAAALLRSEERRVGEEGRYRLRPQHSAPT